MSDKQEGCEWVNVSSGTGSLGQRSKAVKRLYVCVRVFYTHPPSTSFRDTYSDASISFRIVPTPVDLNLYHKNSLHTFVPSA